MDIEKVGQFIKELRIENNLSQNQLSEEIHVTRQAVSNWENGKALPDSNVLLILSNLFKVSINEILSGKRLTKEDNLEEIALQLVDENNQKRNKIKKMMISFSTILSVLVIIFLGYYFITNYNSIKVYKVSGKSTLFKTNEGILITTRNKTYLHLGEIEKLNKDDSINIIKVILYYKEGNKKIVIYEKESTNYLIKEIENYNEFSLSKNKNNLYLEVEYDKDKSDIIKLKLTEDFKNNFIKHNNSKKQKIVKEETKPKIKKEVFGKLNNDLSVAEEQLEVNSLLRRDEDNIQSPEEDVSQPKQTEVIENDIPLQEQDNIMNPVNNNIEEELEEEQNLIPTNEDIDSQKIDYDKIIQIIKEKGVEQFGSYVIEFMNNGSYCNISFQNDMISIFTVNDNIMESWMYTFTAGLFNYQKFINYEEIESIRFAQDSTNPSEIDIMKKFIYIIELI